MIVTSSWTSAKPQRAATVTAIAAGVQTVESLTVEMWLVLMVVIVRT
jgi:hypothetical protein